MLATLSDKPFNDKDWIFEIKWDGYRMISKIKNNHVDLASRNLKSFNEKFPLLRRELKKIKYDVVMDGEAVAIDSESKPSFQLLQNYAKTGEGRVIYYIFDLLWYEGYNIKNHKLAERKKLLNKIIPESDVIFYSDHIEEKGKALFTHAKKMGLEGIIAKKSDSLYYENVRTKSWLKLKTIQTQEAVICGYTEPRGSRKFFGALIMGVYEKGKLAYIGHTGTGFDYSNQKAVYSLMNKYKQNSSPFIIAPKTNAPVTWIKPALVCEVKFSHLTDEGFMRHPVFMRMREDKAPKDVKWETK